MVGFQPERRHLYTQTLRIANIDLRLPPLLQSIIRCGPGGLVGDQKPFLISAIFTGLAML
jgi:hypothetical protein